MSFLVTLPEEMITEIVIRVIVGSAHEYLNLRRVCTIFRRICDNPSVLQRLSLRAIRHHLFRQRYAWNVGLLFEERFRLADHVEALCYEGMVSLMTQPHASVVGLALIHKAAELGDSDARYFMAMLQYRSDPADPQARVLLQQICDSPPPPPGGRWENRGVARLRSLVQEDLYIISCRHWLRYCDDPPELVPLVEDPHICTWEQCRRWHEGPPAIWYCSAECRIRHEFDLWTRHLSVSVTYAISRIEM